MLVFRDSRVRGVCSRRRVIRVHKPIVFHQTSVHPISAHVCEFGKIWEELVRAHVRLCLDAFLVVFVYAHIVLLLITQERDGRVNHLPAPIVEVVILTLALSVVYSEIPLAITAKRHLEVRRHFVVPVRQVVRLGQREQHHMKV